MQGGGDVLLSAASLPPGASLPPVQLTRRGSISGVSLRAFVAGAVPVTAAERMVSAAEEGLKKVSSLGLASPWL